MWSRERNEVALLLDEPVGPAPDERAIGAALLGALRVLAAGGPVVVAVDDVQWLDSPSARTLEFALRRLHDEPVTLLLTHRTERPGAPLPLEMVGQGRTRFPAATRGAAPAGT